jgi:hypothetical protein
MLNFNTSYQTPNPKFSLRNFFGIKIDIGDLGSHKSKFFFCKILLLFLIPRINALNQMETMQKIRPSRMIPNMRQLSNMANGDFGKFVRVLGLLNVRYGQCFGVRLLKLK